MVCAVDFQSPERQSDNRTMSHGSWVTENREVTGSKEASMKYICLGYLEPGKIEGMTEGERHATFDDCFEYNDHLRANGHLVAEVPLQPPETALTLYWKNGNVATTDGPYAETRG